ncbi:MAG: restriction endonuclease [Anaerolineae bacterium]|nr:restriction endonuclease [Anaerolineae bacterium]
MSRRSELKVGYTKSGLRRYFIEIWHDELNKYQMIRGDSQRVVEQKARAKIAEWDEMWARRCEREQRVQNIENKKQRAAERTEEAQEALSELDTVLTSALIAAKSLPEYRINPPKKEKPPAKPKAPTVPPEPKLSDFELSKDFIDKILLTVFKGFRERRQQEVNGKFQAAHKKWETHKAKLEDLYATYLSEHQSKLKELDANHAEAIEEWNNRRTAYLNGDVDAVADYFDQVLSESKYPDFVPQKYELEYSPENKILIVDYDLPAVDKIPTLKEVRYIQSRDEFTESHISQSQLNGIYDSLLYQIMLRVLHELYSADAGGVLDAAALNGYVDSIDSATGKETRGCVASVMAKKDEFTEINLALVEPKACFKKLKGIGSSKLHSLTPIAPVLQMSRDDKRFVSEYSVVDSLNEGYNLAAMDWEDFEHLVRELFEKEFSEPGAEVRVTRASRDGGIDAVIFDPDPLRGGKIVIQAKRYTNTVGVSAVRDLYGTLISEGANQGILVSTADYGPDAYEFAKDKPLKLLNGGNLLHLLERQNIKAYIDLKEAKKELAEKNR